MFFNERRPIFGEGSMPCVHTSPDELYAQIGRVLGHRNISELSRELHFQQLINSLLLDVPTHQAVFYFQQVKEAEISPDFLHLYLKEYNSRSSSGLFGPFREVGLFQQIGEDSIPYLRLRFMNEQLKGTIRAGFWMSNEDLPQLRSLDVPFPDAMPLDLELGKHLLEINSIKGTSERG
jgi:hypothetical protein